MQYTLDTDAVTKLSKAIIKAIDEVSEELERPVVLAEVSHAFSYYLHWAGTIEATENRLNRAYQPHTFGGSSA